MWDCSMDPKQDCAMTSMSPPLSKWNMAARCGAAWLPPTRSGRNFHSHFNGRNKMKTIRASYLLSITAILLTVLSAALAETLNSFKGTDDIAVVVNEKNAVTAVSMSDLRKILLGERKFWKGNAPVQLVLRDPGARERDKVIGLS